MATPEQIKQFREYVAAQPDKAEFIQKFKSLDSDEKRDIAIQRVLEKAGVSTVESTPQQPIDPVVARQADRTSIPFRAPSGIVDPMFALQNVGALGQREEAAVAGPILALQQGKGLKEAGKQAIAGLKGEQQTELGDVFTQAGATEEQAKLFGFLSSMGLPSSWLGSKAAKGATATEGASKFVSRQLESATNMVAGVKRKTIKSLRDVVDRLGVKNVFNSQVESPEFIGKTLAPEVTEVVQKNIKNLKPNTLRQIGVDQQTIDKVSKIQKEFGIKEYLSQTEADNLWSKLFSNIDPAIRIDVNPVVDKLDVLAKDAGELPIGSKLKSIADRLKKSSTLDETMQSKGAIIGKDTFEQVRTELNQLSRSGSDEIKRFASQAKIALDDALSEQVSEFNKVKGHFAISRELEKVKNFIDDPELISLDDPQIVDKIASKLKSAQGEGAETKRKIIESLVGKKNAEKIVDLLEANRILTSEGKGGVASASSSGITSIPGRLARKGIRTNEEKVAPAIRKFSKSALARFGKKAVGATERATARRATVEFQD